MAPVYWRMEVFKMACYITFPVGLFHFFNSPGYIEDKIAEERKAWAFGGTAEREAGYLKLWDEMAHKPRN